MLKEAENEQQMESTSWEEKHEGGGGKGSEWSARLSLGGSRATAQRFAPRLIRETVRLELCAAASKQKTLFAETLAASSSLMLQHPGG